MSADLLHVDFGAVLEPSESRDLLSSILAVHAFGVIWLDGLGRIVVCNGAAARILGSSPEEVVGRQVTDFAELRADGVPFGFGRALRLLADGPGTPHEARNLSLTRKDGSRLWLRVDMLPTFDAGGTARRVLVTLVDVTSSHEDQDALRVERRRLARSGDRFRRVLESVPDAIAVYHEQGFGYANAALVSLFGYESGAALVGKDVTTVLRGHTPLVWRAPRLPPVLREESWRRVDGTVAIVEIATHGIDLDGAEGTLLIARDITERKRAQSELMQSTRLASLGTLAAGVAHEVNNPLTYVIANLELMSEELGRLHSIVSRERLAELASMVEDARSGAESVRKIVRGLKVFSRTDEERRVTLDVTAVLDVSINMAWNEIRHRARLVRDYGPIPHVNADEGRLGQVFLNLLVNAAQAIPEGQAETQEIRVVTATDGAGRAVIEIHDTGVGMPDDVCARVFDPFFTTKPIGVGSGLGLSICRGLITELGGDLSVESTVGKGTMLRVILPSASEIRRLTGKPPAEVVAQCRRARVLVVDDDPNVAQAVRKALTREHDVVVVDSGIKALGRIGAGEVFDVILSDLMMPEMTGMTLHAELTAMAPALSERVVFITGGAFSPGAVAFLERVPNARLDKPFDVGALRKLVRRFVPA